MSVANIINVQINYKSNKVTGRNFFFIIFITNTQQHHVQHHHYYQQTLHKHTQAETVVEDNTTTTIQQNRSKSNNNMITSSVFSTYTKEESFNKKQLKHLQQQKQLQQTQQQPTHQTDMPVRPSKTKTTTTTANPVHIPYNIDWVFERLKNPNGLWYICSQIAIFAVGLFSKIVLGKFLIYNSLLKIHIYYPYLSF